MTVELCVDCLNEAGRGETPAVFVLPCCVHDEVFEAPQGQDADPDDDE